MARIVAKVLALCLSLSAGSVYAESLSGRFDLSYSEANPDFSPFSNGQGVGAYGRVSLENSIFAMLRHTDVSFEPSGPVSGDEVDVWQEAGIGYAYALSDDWTIEGVASFQRIEQGSESESGHEVQLGVVYQALPKLELDLSVGQLDLQIDDWNLDFEARYLVYERYYLVSKLRDYADWDFTYYEVGLGVTF